ncbi:hypothetical protein [Micromonospora sp. RTGN7]|uniref:AtuA-related protein n=1 Tax=Micromonospora sp. RTGN7 TaxID=3016526 RepID=UPI0029FF2831|nr:hypothetical protein [Micromonospora sp. RTGN7]
MTTVPLGDLAFTRSGDKGERSNICVLAFDAAGFARIDAVLTPKLVLEFFAGLADGPVTIYRVPNMNAFNVVVDGTLGGGSTRTLWWDVTGKSMGNHLMRLPIEAPGD